MTRRPLVAVVGDGNVEDGDPKYLTAREIGRLLVDAGARLICGGLGGIMEAAARGAHDSVNYREGDTIGLLPGFDPNQANKWVDIAIPTGLEHLRNGLIANADCVIAIGGGAGTLSEIAFAWMYKRPVISLDCDGWSGKLAGVALDTRREAGHASGATVLAAKSASEAVAIALERLGSSAPRRGIT